VEIPTTILDLLPGQYGRGREKAPVLAQVRVKALGLPLACPIWTGGAHMGLIGYGESGQEQPHANLAIDHI